MVDRTNRNAKSAYVVRINSWIGVVGADRYAERHTG